MTRYRIYAIDPRNRVSQPPEVFDFPDDAAAIEKARRLFDGHAVEVWERARLVVRLEPNKDRDLPM